VCDLSPDGPRLREWLAACRDARGLLKTTVPLRRDDGTLVDVRIEASSLPTARPATRRPLLLRFRSRPRGAGAGAASPRRATASCSRTPCTASAAATSTAPSSKATRRWRRCSATLARVAGRRSWPTSTKSPTLPDAPRSHPPRRARPQRRRQLAPAQRRSARRPALEALRDGGSPDGVIELLVEDATERRTLEAQLARPRWSRSAAAGGIAHDFNNLLTAILGYVDLMQGSLSEQDRSPGTAPDPPLGRARQPADAPAPRLQPQAVPQPRIIDLNAVVEESNQMLRRLISEHIELSASLDPRLLRIRSTRRSCSRCC
jgi:signal transduction histidine kinase